MRYDLDVVDKIVKHLEHEPHLWLAYVALSQGDADLNGGDVDRFEAFLARFPHLKGERGSSRSLLKAMCSLRFSHLHPFHEWREVVAKFPEAQEAIHQVTQEAAYSRRNIVIVVESSYALRNGKKTRKYLNIAKHLGSTLSDFLEGEGYTVAHIHTEHSSEEIAFPEAHLHIGLKAVPTNTNVVKLEIPGDSCDEQYIAPAVIRELEKVGFIPCPSESGTPGVETSDKPKDAESKNHIVIEIPEPTKPLPGVEAAMRYESIALAITNGLTAMDDIFSQEPQEKIEDILT